MDSPYPHQEYQVNNRAKKIGALILALIIYLLFLGPIVIDIIPTRWRVQPFMNVQDSSIKKPQRAQPAPVKYASPQAQKTSTLAPPPQAAQAKPISIPPMPEKLPEKPQELQEHYKPVPKSREQESGAPTSELKETHKTQEPKPALLPPTIAPEEAKPKPILASPAEQTKPSQELPLRTSKNTHESITKKTKRTPRGSRAKWFKEPSHQTKEEVEQAVPSSQSQTLSKQLARGFSEHMQANQRPQGLGEGSLYTGDPAGDFEINIFNETFNRNFCKASEFNPLFLTTGLPIKPHAIMFEVTCNKQRKVIHASLPQPSYDQRLNAYVIELCKTMPIPQLPSRWPEEALTIRRTINLPRPYFDSKISFSAGQFWT